MCVRLGVSEIGVVCRDTHRKITHVICHDRFLEQIELQAKLLNYFLGSNKSNINQIA